MKRFPDDEREERGGSRSRRTVAIIPASALLRYGELLRALAEAYHVRFVGSGESDVDAAHAVIAFPGARRPEALRVPCLELGDPGGQGSRGRSFTVELARSSRLDRALHGQRLVEHDAGPPASVATVERSRVLAMAAGRPIWVQSCTNGIDHEIASALPQELADHEFLRDRLMAGRFWSLLPIVHFLKRISARSDVPGEPPARAACFVIDDPNPRLSSYGYVSFPELARAARACNYHVACATIPLDLLVPGQAAVGVFRRSRSELSLAVHGNDHVRRELERCRTTLEADRIARSALARVARFEARSGIRVDRVMCPPHGACNPEMLAALFRNAFLGLAASRPFPWQGFDDQKHWRLGGWLPAQLAGGGLPVIPRYSLSRNLEDVVFRAFLGQPLILYCHQCDLRDGLEPLGVAATRVAELGGVEWMSLSSVARANAQCRERDGVATVTVYSRDVRIRRPTAPEVRVEVPSVFEGSDLVRLVVDGTPHVVKSRADGGASILLPNARRSGELRIMLPPTSELTPGSVRDWRPRAWPVARRVMTETRDRMLPRVGDLRR